MCNFPNPRESYDFKIHQRQVTAECVGGGGTQKPKKIPERSKTTLWKIASELLGNYFFENDFRKT